MKFSVPGLLLILIGVLFLLRNLGFELHLGELFATWWPLGVIAIGIGMVIRERPRG